MGFDAVNLHRPTLAWSKCRLALPSDSYNFLVWVWPELHRPTLRLPPPWATQRAVSLKTRSMGMMPLDVPLVPRM
jgi:hypothetical protein